MCNVAKRDIAACGAQGVHVRLGKALVAATQRVGEGNGFQHSGVHHGRHVQRGQVLAGAHGVDHGCGHIVERLRPACTQVEHPAMLGVVKEPELGGHQIPDGNKIAHLLARLVLVVCAKQLDAPLRHELVEIVERHGGHAPFVLLARAIHVKVAEPRNLRCQSG